MIALLLLLTAIMNVSAVSDQHQSLVKLRYTRRDTSLNDCASETKRCHGSDFLCRYGSSRGMCLNDTCRCPDMPNRDACTCLPQIGDCHIKATSETSSSGSRNYSCIVPDNLNPNFDVHILSVYEAIRGTFRQHPTGTSYVSLVISGEVVKPIILVLVSYEPIEWRLSVPLGVEIERVLLSSFFLENSSVLDTNDRVKAIEKVSRQDFPSGFGEDSGGGNTVKLLESTVARFGPIASFRGTYRANRWTLPIALENTSRPCPCPPAPANGRVTNCSGYTVTYTCNDGYTLSGSNKQTCQSGGGWSSHIPSCAEVGTASNITTMVSGVVGAFVLTLVSLVAVVAIVVVLWRRVKRRSLTELTQRRVESQERSGTIEVGQEAGEKGTKEKAVAIDMEALYQELDERTQDHYSVYAQRMKGDTYQELNPWSREMDSVYAQRMKGDTYQELNPWSREMDSVYAQRMKGGTYQELNPWSREMEHHYQTVNQGKEGHGRRGK